MNLLNFIQAKHNLIFKIFMVLLCSFLLSLMMPDRQVKGHRVDAFSAVWPYEDLVTDEEFYIRKSESELRREKEKIRREAPVFYNLNENEKFRKLRELENLRESDQRSYHLLKPLFDSIYQRGVIETVEGVTDAKSIFISAGSYAEVASLYDFFTIQSAAWFLENSLRGDNLGVNYLDYLAINYHYDKDKTNMFLNSKLQQISVFKSVVPMGQVLVRKGEVLTNNKRFLINRYFFFRNQNVTFLWSRFFAKWGLTFILSMVLLTFLAFFRKPIFGQNTQVAFLLLLLLVSVSAAAAFNRYGLMIMSLPFALVPIMVRVFFDGRTSLFTYLMVVLHCSFFMADKLEFILLQLLPGIGTLFAVAEMRKRQQILNAAAGVFIFYVLIFVTYHLGFGTSVAVFKVSSYIPFAISSMLVLLAYPLIYLTEKFFGFISDFKLLELCDLNHPLLRRLSKDVPGTFQHSLQVANLAEEAIFYIGGNSLLVRAGAMYHDIGKMQNPNFFTENQANGFSPHQEIEPLESARIIINHVIVGVEMAKKYKLPEQVIDFIRTHHGTTSVRYFYDLFRKQHGADMKVNESQFRYPGPIPFSKETAVLMIADGVEAASRSLKTHDAVAINDLVDNIIEYKIVNNQFINSDITFKDITTIKKIFKKRLMNIYHARIEYPA
jgi:cyclic-di-AMP phosphodiesterase PgpH